MKTEHTLIIKQDCKVLKNKELLLEAVKALPSDIEIVHIFSSGELHQHPEAGLIRVKFSSEELGSLPDLFNIAIKTELKLVRQPAK